MSQQTETKKLDEIAGGGKVRLADQAYLRIRDDIVTIRHSPGAPLDEKVLSAELGFGLTPVRDALKRLTLERLAVIYPRRGTFVTDINISDERWLTEVRIELEGAAAALAAERATEEELTALRDHTALLESHDVGRDMSSDYLSIDTEIHRMVYAAARNPYLEDTLNQYANLALRIWHYGIKRMRPTTPSCSQRDVVNAIGDRDPARARAAAQVHLRGFSEEVRTLL